MLKTEEMKSQCGHEMFSGWPQEVFMISQGCSGGLLGLLGLVGLMSLVGW